MSRYRIVYAPPADDARKKMPTGLKSRFDAAMRPLAADPYGSGSEAVDGERDRRQAVAAGVLVRYYVAGAVLTVTVVRIVYV
ncbi:type II toxin-antitoxin system RelE family toxin [Streptomyces ginkgonis]|uniref:type II toxin-antitoxin system RelE family toxin n=1 Tax=Streptomyces ginkgonis TaxID=1812259 RepID=UPI002176BD68|nr:hypothetical protein [Streptomyces ginkgonis]